MSVLRGKIKEQACLALALSLEAVMRVMRGRVMELLDGAALRIWVTREVTAGAAGGPKKRVAGEEAVIREGVCGFMWGVCEGVAVLITVRVRGARGEEGGGEGFVLKVVNNLRGESELWWGVTGGLVH